MPPLACLSDFEGKDNYCLVLFKLNPLDRGLEKGYRGTARYEKAGREARRKVASKDM